MTSTTYDYIVAGAGAAGLSLAYHMVQAGLDARILILDRAPKTQNDRTWCFWEAGDNPFSTAIHRSWDKLWFYGPGFEKRLDIAPYAYKMIRGADFYALMYKWLESQPQIDLKYAPIEHIDPSGTVQADQTYKAQWVFNSLYNPAPRQPGYYYWLQHFKGWTIRTRDPVFDVQAATFMDFRTPQAEDVRFVYVLPKDPHTALVEYTVFSPHLLEQSVYDAALEDYLQQFAPWEILETEYGIIPMYDAPFPGGKGQVVNIGIAGGRAKASTGYTFNRILRQSKQIALALKAGQPPGRPRHSRYNWFDSVLLNVLDHRRDQGAKIFADLFRSNPPQRVLKFLDEETTLLEDLQIMASVDIKAFSMAALQVTKRHLGF
jgi:lycopene beta-cyclase